jgi:peptidase E
MKTKYILHGGYAGKKNKKNDKFFKEILSINKKKLNILLVYFAQCKKEYDRIKSEDYCQFNSNGKNKILNFEIAEKDKFIKQIKRSDIIYLHGGKTLKLLNILRKYKNFAKLIEGKIIAGESAGAYVLSSYFYSKSIKKCSAGLKLVPVKTICHYVGENRNKLSECPSNLKELLLKDFEYKVFKI